MAGWTAASLFPQSLIRDAINPNPTGPLTPEQKLRLSGGVTRRAFNAPAATPTAVVPGSTGPGTGSTGAGTVIIPAATSGANSATSVVPSTTNSTVPPFLQGGDQQLPSDAMTQLLEALGLGQRQDPKLVEAQTVLAQQQAMQVARGNEAARRQESNQAAMGYLQSQMQAAAKYKTGSVGNILMQRYSDRAKILQSQGELNWLNMPSSSYSVPKKSGWTGPATPGTWGL